MRRQADASEDWETKENEASVLLVFLPWLDRCVCDSST